MRGKSSKTRIETQIVSPPFTIALLFTPILFYYVLKMKTRLSMLVSIVTLLMLTGLASATLNFTTITSPTEGGYYTSSLLTRGIVNDYANVTYEFDSNTTVYTACYNCTLFENYTTLADGLHNVTINATNFTNSSDSVAIVLNFTTDGTDPTLTVSAPVEGHTYYTRTVTLESAAADATSGLASCVYSLNGGSSTSFTCSSDVSLTAHEGSNTVAVTVTDNSGNTQVSTKSFSVFTAMVATHICGNHICTAQELEKQGVSTTLPSRVSGQIDTGYVPQDITLPVVGAIPTYMIGMLLFTIIIIVYKAYK